MTGVPKHPNEYHLTRLYIARLFDRAVEKDIQWIRSELSDFTANTWRYKNGLRALPWRQQGGPLAILEKRFPGSLATFHSATGQILLGKKLSESELIEAIRALGDSQRTILLGAGCLPNHPGQRYRTLYNLFDELEYFPEYSTIEALIIMLAWADQIQNHRTWNEVCSFYRYMIPQFIYFRNIAHCDIVMDAVDAFATFRDFKANGRNDRFCSWRAEIPRAIALHREAQRETMIYYDKWNAAAPACGVT